LLHVPRCVGTPRASEHACEEATIGKLADRKTELCETQERSPGALNVTAYASQREPDRFIPPNLALSFQAACAAKFVMAAKNRQQHIDRQAAETDHRINIKAEPEIELPHLKFDQMRRIEVLYLTKAVNETSASLGSTTGRPLLGETG
jgi:hypothetical protein